MAIQPHQQRVIDEKEDLDVKIEKLSAFTRSQAFENVPMAERHLLREQLMHMERYSATLGARIALHKES